jgi:hypothetical protein
MTWTSTIRATKGACQEAVPNSESRALSSPPEQTVLPTPEVAASRHQGLPALDHEGPGAQELLSGIRFVFQGLESVLGWRLRCLDKGLWRSRLSVRVATGGARVARAPGCGPAVELPMPMRDTML